MATISSRSQPLSDDLGVALFVTVETQVQHGIETEIVLCVLSAECGHFRKLVKIRP